MPNLTPERKLNWTPLAQANPEKDRLLDWIAPDGREVRGRFLGGLIWMPEGSDCYVYYTPLMWRYVE